MRTCVVLIAVLVGGPSVWAGGATRPATAPAGKVGEADAALIRKLLRDATGRGEGPAMERVLNGMRASRIKQSVQFDAGGDTQKIQRGIVRDLAEAIAEAWRSQRSQPTTSRSPSGERRRRHRKQATSAQAGAQQTGPSRPKADESATHGVPTTGPARLRGAMRELRRGWGRLPARDRDQVVQGFGQDFLTKYREWIERYYRALAGPEEE